LDNKIETDRLLFNVNWDSETIFFFINDT
jgi:hypothetical protein